MKIYDTIIIGAGAAGLYCGCKLYKEQGRNVIILEKGQKSGLKLLMAGGGQCNVTHGGSIKDFLNCYGDNGRFIRSALQKHNNTELCRFLESLGVRLYEREDGKVFPKSLNSHDVLRALSDKISENNIEIKFGACVRNISVAEENSNHRFSVGSTAGDFLCKNLVVATGGCSYPTTGSDGQMLKILKDNLGIEIINPAPALTSVVTKNYIYGELRGMSFSNIEITVISDDNESRPRKLRGDLLFAERTLSGPVILNGSRYMKPGDILRVNYLYPRTGPEVIARCKAEFPGNGKSPQSYISDELGLPKRFAKAVAEELGIGSRKVSQLSGKEIKSLADAVTQGCFKIEKLSGFSEAMVTAGGVSLEEMDLKRMCLKSYEGLYIIGEVLDVDGDTGGYNLQFAYSSASAAADDINKR